MPSIGGQPGNQNAAKGKQWRAAIERALEARTASRVDGKKELDAVAEKLVEAAGSGDISALRELGDRLDGKPHQSSDVSVEGGEGLLAVLAGMKAK